MISLYENLKLSNILEEFRYFCKNFFYIFMDLNEFNAK